MPTIAENFANWNDPKRWSDDGNEWSHAWGSSATMWFGSILPRIAANLPAASLLEIACGHGRVTEFLLPHCQRYVGVDLAPDCVATCERRFAGVGKSVKQQGWIVVFFHVRIVVSAFGPEPGFDPTYFHSHNVKAPVGWTQWCIVE